MLYLSFRIRAFGARSVARSGRPLALQNRDFGRFYYPPGASATVYLNLDRPGGQFPSIGAS